MVRPARGVGTLWGMVISDLSGSDVVQVTTRTFRGSQVLGILVVTAVGMQLMMVVLMLRLPAAWAFVALLGGISVTLGFMAGDVVYSLDDQGVRRVWRPLASRFLKVKATERLVTWAQVEDYRHDRDLTRSLQELEFLEIDVREPKARWVVTDRQDAPGFGTFRDAFLARVSAPDVATSGAAISTNDLSETITGRATEIRRRRGFYETIWAKLLSALFLVAALGWLGYAATGGLDRAQLFRFGVVIFPGLAYILWRTWGRRQG